MPFRDMLKHNIKEYAPYITKLIKMAMQMFTEGLSHQKNQKGAIFGFGPKANDDTGTKLAKP